MSRPAMRELESYLLQGSLSRVGCRRTYHCTPRRPLVGSTAAARPFRSLHAVQQQPDPTIQQQAVPLRKQLKDEAKQTRKKDKKKSLEQLQIVKGWELTVGIEIHAQLNTSRKLFSPAVTSFNDNPNSHVALFDVAMPGSQPLFQNEVLIPALRAALSLNCDIQFLSRFDRKHYFWWDQPSGYQITQYYQPFAKNGKITLLARDGLLPEEGESITVDIKQVQLEQDTAKSLAKEDAQWLDFNRVGVPLIEIITEPQIHRPHTAAVLVRKIQLLLNSVDACVSGMEAGGLRADVNVSVRRTGGSGEKPPLGTRTEIKNLSTIKAVEYAIIAERDRQIREIEAGGKIASETRGWTLGTKETQRLRGKEGEVDYRYMPDPDIAPLIIGQDLVEHLKQTMAVSPDTELDSLTTHLGLTAKDAVSLLNLDDGARVQFFYRVLRLLEGLIATDVEAGPTQDLKAYAGLVGNWTIHELGRLTTSRAGPLGQVELDFTPEGECIQIPDHELAQILYHLHRGQITGKVAKELLMALYLGELDGGVSASIDAHDLWFRELTTEEYMALVDQVLREEDGLLQSITGGEAVSQGRLMFIVGKMMRTGPTERINPATAEKTARSFIETIRGD